MISSSLMSRLVLIPSRRSERCGPCGTDVRTGLEDEFRTVVSSSASNKM
jgi:hypothetical protein